MNDGISIKWNVLEIYNNVTEKKNLMTRNSAHDVK